MLDLLIINPGNRTDAYQSLGNEIAAIEQPTFSLLVARYLINKGYSVQVIDVPAGDLTYEEIAKSVEEYDPVLVGMYVYGHHPSASTQHMDSAIKICRAIQELNPKRHIMASGTHPSALPQQTLLELNIEYVCDREGFVTPAELIDCIKAGGDDIEKVQDLWYLSNGKPTFTSRGNILIPEELDSLCASPMWELVDMSVYRSHNWHAFWQPNRQPYASIYTSLGCPYKCTFCCINTPFGDMLKGPRPYRLWSPDVIINQIDTLVNKYGVYHLKFVDEMFVLNPDHVLRLCDLIIERGYKLNIWAYARIDTVKDKFLEKLKKAGFNWLALGIESASKHVRDGADKKYTNDDIVNVVDKIRQYDIYTIGNYIFGLPDDDRQSVQNTLDLALQLKTECINFYSAMAYPGSPLYTMAVQNGWELPKTWLGYSQHSYECLPLKTEHMSSAEVLKFRDDAFVRCYTDPDYRDHLLKVFGQATIDGVDEMLKYSLKRKILEN